MGLDRFTKTPCGFCFVEYYTHQDALDCLKYIGGTKLDERIIRTDLDPGFEEGRQYGYDHGFNHQKLLHGTDIWAVAESPVVRFAMNTAKSTTPVAVAMVGHTQTTNDDARKKITAKVGRKQQWFHPVGANTAFMYNLFSIAIAWCKERHVQRSFRTQYPMRRQERCSMAFSFMQSILSVLFVSLPDRLFDLAQPPQVDSGIRRQLGVETGPEDIALLDSDDVTRLLLWVRLAGYLGGCSR